jgi:large conductance mechanosensitive channel
MRPDPPTAQRAREIEQKALAHGSKLWQEFKAFALKGNFVDLAVAVVLGAATTGVINSLVKNVIMPALDYLAPSSAGSYRTWHLGKIEIGLFLGELVNFLVIAIVLFLIMVKLLGTIQKAAAPPADGEPATKECPLCLSVIPFKARKCAHCTADLPDSAPEPVRPA